jgi:hypothetical protein
MTSPEYKFGTWYPILESPEGIPVNTRINDLDGIRNEQVMTRSGRLWWIKDMYVYYQPTEWSPLPPPPVTRGIKD